MRPRLNRSLSAHLRATEDHSRLPFHPSCPVCRRDRLAGSLDGEEVLSRRTQAALAAGVLAFSTGGGSAVAVASPPDEVSEGTAEVVVGEDQGSDPEFDPGLETVQLPDEAAVAPLPMAPDGEEIAVVEQEPQTDTLEPKVDMDVDEAAVPPTEPEPATSEAAPPPAPEPSLPVDPVESAPQEPQAGPKDMGGGQRRFARAGDGRQAEGRAEARDAPAVVPAQPPPEPIVAVAPTTAPAAGQTASGTVAVVDSAQRETATAADRGHRFHTVRHGESLWSIAADLLGENAGVASIAREVNRLWELNDERIGTGRPDLLYAGTRLRLR